MTGRDQDLLNVQPTTVAKPARAWSVPVGVGAAVLAGVAVFTTLSAHRTEKPGGATTLSAAFEPPPPPLESVAAPQAFPSAQDVIPAPYMAGLGETPPKDRALPSERFDGTDAAKTLDQRRRSPSVVVDLSAGAAQAAPGALSNPALAKPSPMSTGPGDDKKNADEAFARRLSGEAAEVAQSSRLAHPSLTAPQGTIVPAVLETALNSDLPGFVRAVVTRDVRAFDGETVVIPRGAKLVGQYRNGVAAGQSRAFVVWTRLLRPDGVTIDLGSPGVDDMGRGGLQGRTDQHFLQRFGAAILLSVVGGATARDGGTVVIGSAQDASHIAEIALNKQIDIPPTIKVAQGTPIRVFVARDLVFDSAARR
jgi:type IV secretion system protein VirB10